MPAPARSRPILGFAPGWALVAAASVAACAEPTAGDDADDGETGEDLMCDVADPPALVLEPGRRELSLVARREDIPGIGSQPTASGRTISALWPHQGRVHLGYGDYTENTGPISMVSYVPDSASFEEHGVASSEEIQRFATHGGELFTSNIDPRGHQFDGSVFRLEAACGEWEEGMPIDGAAHTYALLEHDGRIWVGTGSLLGAPALVMSSDDGGRSWREEFAVDSDAESFTRILDGAVVGDHLLFTGRSFPTDGATNFGWQRRAGDWTEVGGVPDVSRVVPIAFAGTFVVLAFSGDVGKGGSFAGGYTLEGDALVSHDWFPAGFVPVNWQVIAPDAGGEPWLWVLGRQDGASAVLVTPDLESWETIATVPAFEEGTPRSLALEANALFLGTSIGDLYVVDEIFVPG